MEFYISNQFSWLQSKDPIPFQAQQIIEKLSSYEVPRARFSDKFKAGMWDGRKHLGFETAPSEKNPFYAYTIPTGVAAQAVWELKKLVRKDILDDFQIINLRLPPKALSSHFKGIEGFTLRPHQERMIQSILPPKENPLQGILDGLYMLDADSTRSFYAGVGMMSPLRLHGMGIWWSSTGSGKTNAAAELIGRLGVKTLFLVYGNNLVIQTFERFQACLGPWLREAKKEMAICIEGNFSTADITIAGTTTLALHLNVWRNAQDAAKVLIDQTIEHLVKEDVQGGDESKKLLASLRRGLREPSEKLSKKMASLESQALGLYWRKPKPKKDYDENIAKLRGYTKQRDALEQLEKRTTDYLASVDLLILDEAHGASANTTYDLLSNCPAYFRVALSGTPLDRAEGSNLKVVCQFGDVSARVTNKEMVEAGYVPPAKIIFLPVEGKLTEVSAKEWAILYNCGVADYLPRNQKILQVIKEAYDSKEQVLLIFRTMQHGENLSLLLADESIPHTVVTGEHNIERREEVLSSFKEGLCRVLLASEIFGTGIDIPNGIDVLINAAGGKASVPILQRLGRGLRGKDEVKVYDFMDKHHNTLHKHSKERLSIYQGQGCFEIERRDLAKGKRVSAASIFKTPSNR